MHYRHHDCEQQIQHNYSQDDFVLEAPAGLGVIFLKHGGFLVTSEVIETFCDLLEGKDMGFPP